jgi:hypothetical protein
MGWIKPKNHLATVPLKLLNTGCTKVLLFLNQIFLLVLLSSSLKEYKNTKIEKRKMWEWRVINGQRLDNNTFSHSEEEKTFRSNTEKINKYIHIYEHRK